MFFEYAEAEYCQTEAIRSNSAIIDRTMWRECYYGLQVVSIYLITAN